MSSWRVAAYRAARPALFLADAEFIHHLVLRLLGSSAGRLLAPIAAGAPDATGAPIELMGLRFRNRIGVGAGFDKDGLAIRGWAALGLGFVELGTVTPRPQPGNPRPRLFRIPGDEALINRMGFNNEGAEAARHRLEQAQSVARGPRRIGRHELVPDLRPGGRRIIELLDGHDALKADGARLAVIGLVVVLVVRRHLDGVAQRGLLVGAVDEDHAILDHRDLLGGAGEVHVAQLDGEPSRRLHTRLVGGGCVLDHHDSPTTVCDCSRRNCWT